MAGTALLPAHAAAPAVIRPRSRVILDNDYAGDPDGLFQMAHHLLSPTTQVRAIVGSHLHANEAFLPNVNQATASAAKARELLSVMGLADRHAVIAGAEGALKSDRPPASAASDAIIAEVLRADESLPLFYCAGAGLTDLATAWLREPRIARHLTLVWIGGPEYPGVWYPPPKKEPSEYNLTIDIKAVQTIFGKSDIDIWQVPRSTYRQMMVSYEELLDKVRPSGALGDYLVSQIERVMEAVQKAPGMGNLGEVYILGDSPLVTLTALMSPWTPDPSSSLYVTRPCPNISDQGEYVARPDGRPIRVYTQIDTRLTFEDLYAKLRHAPPAPRRSR
jgi:inosine-uridine nucleoside N-ribohydrolase